LWILKVLPELDYLVGIFRPEFEPKNKQHVLPPHFADYPGCPELHERICGGTLETALSMFQGIDR
jgi:hypothetical protein